MSPPTGRTLAGRQVVAHTPGSKADAAATSMPPATACGGPPAEEEPTPAGDPGAEAGSLLAAPGLVILTGGPGAGRSTALRRLAEAFHGPVYLGGGLAMLRTTPALALTRAVRVRLPAHDPALLAEAVRSRVRGGLLLIDDLQWADPATLAALPPLAAHCRVAAALRTPHHLPPAVEQALRDTAAGWLAIPPLTPEAATRLIHQTAPGLDPAAVAAVLARAGGVPLAVRALARHAHLEPAGGGQPGGPASSGPAMTRPDDAAPDQNRTDPDPDEAAGPDQLAYAITQALADLTRPARTAMAALGLLGRPATAQLLGPGVDELAAATLVTVTTTPPHEVSPVSPYLAEIAAGLLDPPTRQALHRRLAGLVPPTEAARHLAAAGDTTAAYRQALTAAAQAPTTGERAEALLLACHLPGTQPPPSMLLDAAQAALACGRPHAAVHLLRDRPDPAAAVLRAEALLQLGETANARSCAATVPDHASAPLLAARDRILLLTPGPADLHRQIIARHGDPPAHPGLRAALAAVRATRRTPGWEHGLASAATAAGAAGDPLAARWSAWLLVETLTADGRLTEAAQTARAAATACAADLAYSWQTRFLAAELWCTALRGTTPASETQPTPDTRPTAGDRLAVDEVLRRAGDLTDRTLPTPALGYAVAAASLLEADGGLLAPARARLAGVPTHPGPTAALLDWVSREAAWLDGQPGPAIDITTAPAGASPLVAGLRRITAHWAASDTKPEHLPRHPQPGHRDPDPYDADSAPVGEPGAGPADVAPTPIRETLAAWADADPGRFARAAKAWHDLAIREEVRCLLAQGLRSTDPAQAVTPLLAAAHLADAAGLVVLAGRARQQLRHHAAYHNLRDPRTPPRPGAHRGTAGTPPTVPRQSSKTTALPGEPAQPSGPVPAGTSGQPRAMGQPGTLRPAGSELTGRESQVLRLVAHGEPTRRIARQLGISSETVETHIRSGMRKLRARTRTEAAALALELVTRREETR